MRSLSCEHSMPLWLWGAASTQQPQWPLWAHITHLTCGHTCIHTYVHTTVQMYVTHEYSFIHILHTYIHILHTYIHILHTYIHILHTYIRSYIHTHTYAHTGHMYVCTLSTPNHPHTSLQELIHVRIYISLYMKLFFQWIPLHRMTSKVSTCGQLGSLLTPCSLCGTAYFTACICLLQTLGLLKWRLTPLTLMTTHPIWTRVLCTFDLGRTTFWSVSQWHTHMLVHTHTYTHIHAHTYMHTYTLPTFHSLLQLWTTALNMESPLDGCLWVGK